MYARDAGVAGSIPAWTIFHPLIAAEKCSIRYMPVQKPRDIDGLWKSRTPPLGLSKPYPHKAPFWLPRVNPLTGIVVNQPDLTKEMRDTYAKQSAAYWAGVKARAEARALRRTLPLDLELLGSRNA